MRSVDKKKPGGLAWANFFNKSENKKDLMKLLYFCFQTDECRNLFEIPLIIDSGENILGFTKETIEVLPISNHEEANTRLLFHAGMKSKAAVIVVKYVDMFLLLIYALGQMECFLRRWYLKTDFNQFVNISMIFENLGSSLFDVIPQLHTLTGCDTGYYTGF